MNQAHEIIEFLLSEGSSWREKAECLIAKAEKLGGKADKLPSEKQINDAALIARRVWQDSNSRADLGMRFYTWFEDEFFDDDRLLSVTPTINSDAVDDEKIVDVIDDLSMKLFELVTNEVKKRAAKKK